MYVYFSLSKSLSIVNEPQDSDIMRNGYDKNAVCMFQLTHVKDPLEKRKPFCVLDLAYAHIVKSRDGFKHLL